MSQDLTWSCVKTRWWRFNVDCHKEVVATLALGSRPRQGLARARAKRKPKNVGECDNGHSQSQLSSHFGSWSPNGLPNLHRIITGVKTHRIEDFFISLEN
jgi:hypothetical protein